MKADEVNNLDFYIIIPAYNEEANIEKCLESLTEQTYLPTKILVVDDNSTDNTAQIVGRFCEKHRFIDLLQKDSSTGHQPGAKIVKAFYAGLNELNTDFDIICKFDADLIFPENYLEVLNKKFTQNPKLGIAGGFCYIEKDGEWVPENLTDKTHVRGALKAYRKECFQDIDGLKKAMGWDTLDELLARYHGWQVQTFEELKVKHLRPTGESYKSTKHVSGEALYRMQYGSLITMISSAKMAWLKKDLNVFKNNMTGYYAAKKEERPFLVSDEEGKWIRKYRWKNMFKKLF